jgi:thiol-disulfide isomerase/thioredoxin
MSSPKDIVEASVFYRLVFLLTCLLTCGGRLLQNAIAQNTIVVFSKSWCPYCRRAKQLLAKDYADSDATILEYVSLLLDNEFVLMYQPHLYNV